MYQHAQYLHERIQPFEVRKRDSGIESAEGHYIFQGMGGGEEFLSMRVPRQ
jgi:hypothetical protein